MLTHESLATNLTIITGDTWKGHAYELDEDRNFSVTRERDGLTLNVNRGIRTAWHISLVMRDGGEWLGDRLPYFLTRESAEAAGKPWGRVNGKYAGGGINASFDKTAEQIARDIVRRSLPMVNPAWAHIQASLAETRDYHNAASALADELASLAGVAATHDRGDHRIDGRALLGGGWGDVEVYRDSVNLKLRSLTPDQARAVVKALAGIK